MHTILIIEDDVDLREEIVLRLEFDAYRVLEADDGAGGIALMQQHMPDVVLCDINMPGMNGYDVLSEVRSLPGLAGIPFLFLTAQADKASIRQGMMLGADDYITKPFDYADLQAAIRVRIEKAQQTEMTVLQTVSRLMIQDDDRRQEHLALRLRDDVAAPLNSVRMFLKSTEQQADPVLQGMLHNATQRLDDTQNMLEQLQTALTPQALSYLGTVPMIHWLALQHQQAGDCPIHIQAEPLNVTLPDAMQRHLFYILDEALSNVQQHANATKATVHLWQEDTHLFCSVVDDGVGFEVEAFWANITTLGIVRMRERARLCNGTFDIISSAEAGTAVHIMLTADPATEVSASQRPLALRPQPTTSPPATALTKLLIAHHNPLILQGVQHLVAAEQDLTVIAVCETATALYNLLDDYHQADVLLASAALLIDNADRLLAAAANSATLVIGISSDEQFFAEDIQAQLAGCLPQAAVVDELTDAIRAVQAGERYISQNVAAYKHNSDDHNPLDILTRREREVLEYVANNYPNAHIADELFISIRTVESHRANMMHKLNLNDKAELIIFALKHGIISLED